MASSEWGEKAEDAAKDIIQHCSVTIKPDLDVTDRIRAVEKCMKKIKENPKDPQIFNDPIHGSIKLNSLEQAIINTPEFFRLKDIKQLGGAVHVYPGATHTRFEHSIGVCYIAGQLVQHLREKLSKTQAQVKKTHGAETQGAEKEASENATTIDEKECVESMGELLSLQDEYCIRVAALCHDLGHGPFSHLFGNVAKKVVEIEEHEVISQLMVKKILLDRPLVLANFIRLGLGTTHVEKIASMIDPNIEEIKKKAPVEVQGVSSFKPIFLYEVVANKESGMDVDKWDYFSRDCHYLGLTNEFDWRRSMELSEIILDGKDELHIGFRSKEVNNGYGMFRTRSVLHQKAYQHPVANGIEMMIKDILLEVQDIPMIECGCNKPITWKEAVKNASSSKADLRGYITLTDTILDLIMHHHIHEEQVKEEKEKQKKALKKARELMKGIMSRDENVMYKCTHEESIPFLAWPHEVKSEIAKKEIEKQKNWKVKKNQLHTLRCSADVEIECVPIKFASEKTTDPLQKMYFFSKDAKSRDSVSGLHTAKMLKDDPDTKKKVSKLNLPQAFLEYRVRVYSKKRGVESEAKSALEKVKDHFKL